MKAVALPLLIVALGFPSSHAAEVNPIGKVIQLISDLQGKVIKEGEKAQKVYEEFSEWCEERSKDLSFEIKTGKATVAELTAVIEDETATISSLNDKVEALAAEIATDEA